MEVSIRQLIRFSVILCGTITHATVGLAQQKVQFTQYMFNNMVINPAYAGADEALSLTFIQRSQWTGVDNAPSTQTFSAHTLFMKKNMGLGLTFVNDKIGAHKNLTALGNYAYHIQTGEHSVLSMGLQAGMHYRKSDYASLAGSSYDPRLSNPVLSHVAFDFGMGLYYRSPRFHAGISAPGIIPENLEMNDSISISLDRATVLVYSKYTMPLSETVDAEPSVLLKYMPGLPFSFDINLNVVFRKVLTTGVSYRKDESVDFLLKAQVTPQLQFGYAYDYPIGKIAALSNGSHEIVIHYLFRYIQKNVSSPR
jgi:type IX secretion system PorP/SprF family membrane protein